MKILSNKIQLVIILFSISILSLKGIELPNSRIRNQLKESNQHFFIENKGQWPKEVLYLARMNGLDAWITINGVLYDFYQLEVENNGNRTFSESVHIERANFKSRSKNGHRLLFTSHQSNPNVLTEAKHRQKCYYNYLIGNSSNHSCNVSLYKEVILEDIYKGIDLRYYFDKGFLRYDYIVHAGSNPNQILFSLEGSLKTYTNDMGELVCTTRFGEIQLAELYCYQSKDKRQVVSGFKQNSIGQWFIDLGDYDSKQDLIIDPLIYSTYMGGAVSDFAYSIGLDSSLNAYVTGYTNSPDYDTTLGAYQTIGGGFDDVFVTKLSADGSTLIYSTYIGSEFNHDIATSIAVDALGNAYITGFAGSNFPVTLGAFQTTFGGSFADVFVSKLNPSGTALVYSTFLGGSSYDYGHCVVVDQAGNAYITGETGSTNFDVTLGSFQTLHGGGTSSAFVSKLNNTGTALLYSTYLGGSTGDYGFSIAIDSTGNAYVTGQAISTDFPVTIGAFQTSSLGGDAFISKLNPTGTGLIYSTYLGGDLGTENGYSIAVDEMGNAYVTGTTSSPDYYISTGAYQPLLVEGGASTDAFITKINNTGTAIIYSTYLGGVANDISYSIAIDDFGNAYITGATGAFNYPVTLDAHQSVLDGTLDAFISKINSTGTALLYSTFLGGTSDEQGFEVVLDTLGAIYIVGVTYSLNFDVTFGDYQLTNDGNQDAFVTKIGSCVFSSDLTTSVTGITISANQSNCSYQWINCGTNSAIIGATNQTYTPSSNGTYAVIIDDGNCIDTSACVNITSVNINSNLSNQEIIVYPNPSNGLFFISKKYQNDKIEVLNILGEIVLTTYTNHSNIIDLSNQDDGVYFLKINDSVTKLIKQG